MAVNQVKRTCSKSAREIELLFWIEDFSPMRSSMMGYSPKTGSVLKNALLDSYSRRPSLEQRHRKCNKRHQQRGAGQAYATKRRARTPPARRRRSPSGSANVWSLKKRLPHDPLGGNDVLDARLEMVLMNPFRRIGNGFSRGRKRCLQHRVPDVTAAHRVAARQRLEIDIVRKRSPRRMHLHPPDLRAFGSPLASRTAHVSGSVARMPDQNSPRDL